MSNSMFHRPFLRKLAVQVPSLPVTGAGVSCMFRLGMAILIVALACFARLEAPVGLAATPLLKHMMLCFIPAVAGVMEQFAVLKTGWLPFVAASVLGGALTLVVTAITFQALMKRKEVA